MRVIFRRLAILCVCLVVGCLMMLNFLHISFSRPKLWQQSQQSFQEPRFVDALEGLAPSLVQRWEAQPLAAAPSYRNWSEGVKWQSSSHICFDRDHSPEAARHAACQYRMLCVVSSATEQKGEWYYLAEKHEPQPLINFSTGIGPHHVDDRVFFPVKTTTLESFRKHYPQARIEPHSQFFFSEYNAENYGHFLTDLLFPIYTVLDGFDAVDTDIQLLHFHPKDPIGWSCDYQVSVYGEDARKRCDRFYASLTPMLSKRKVMDLKNVLGQPGNAVCFNNLYVGASRFSAFCFDGADSRGMKEGDPRYPNMNCYSGRQKQLWNFRMYSKANLGIPDVPPHKHQVLIWDRPDKRKFNGLNVLADKIRRELNISVVVVTDWSKFTIEEQLVMIGATTVHITGVGGGSFIALHLPRGATTIRLSRPIDSFMEAWVFDYLGYVHPVYHTISEDSVPVDALMNYVLTGLKRYDAFGVPFGLN